MPVCFYHVTFLKDFFRGGGSTKHLHNIDVVFIKCASKCFFVIYSSQGFIVTFNETFDCKKRLNEYPKTFISIYFFFRDAFQMFF